VAVLGAGLEEGALDWRRKGRIVDLDREVAGAGLAGLFPGCADVVVMRKSGELSPFFSAGSNTASVLKASV
jgi:hypothetical protein